MTDRHERGIALIAVLWVIVLLAIVAASFLTGTRTDTRLARNLVDIATLLAARASTASTARAAGAAGDDGDDGEVAPLPELTGVADHLTRSRQRVYTIRAEARTDTGAVFVREAAVEPLGSLQRPFIVYKWRRGRRLPPLD